MACTLGPMNYFVYDDDRKSRFRSIGHSTGDDTDLLHEIRRDRPLGRRLRRAWASQPENARANGPGACGRAEAVACYRRKQMSECRPAGAPWTPPAVPDAIPHGDMPGDSIQIGETHHTKSQSYLSQTASTALPRAAAKPVRARRGRGVRRLGRGQIGNRVAALPLFPDRPAWAAIPSRAIIIRTGFPSTTTRSACAYSALGGMRGLVQNGLYTQERGDACAHLPAGGPRRRSRADRRTPVDGGVPARRPRRAGRISGFACGDRFRRAERHRFAV